MHELLSYAAFGCVALAGTAEFTVEIIYQSLRRKRSPSPEPAIYRGLDAALALGQSLYGLLCLLLVWRAPGVLEQWPFIMLTALAMLGWLAISVTFMEYRKPRVTTAIFCCLFAASIFTGL